MRNFHASSAHVAASSSLASSALCRFIIIIIMFAIMSTTRVVDAETKKLVNPNADELILEGYWHNWCGGGGYVGGTAPCIQLNEIHPDYNVIMVSFMKVYPGTSAATNGIPTFVLDPEIGMSETEFINQIAELNNQGRTVLISLGGADAHVELYIGQEQALADEIIRLVEIYGFDGLDIDLEQSAITAANNQVVVPAALRIVKDHYREQDENFIIAMAPEFPYLTNDQNYEPYLSPLEGYYDWISPQFYNQAGDGIWSDEINTWVTQSSDELKKEFIYHISDAIVNGKDGFYQITHDKLVFGIPSSNDAAANGYVANPEDLFDAFEMLQTQGQPLLGIMTWSINWDMGTNAAGEPYDQSFVKTYGPYISSRTRPPAAPAAPAPAPVPGTPNIPPTSPVPGTPGSPSSPGPVATNTPECVDTSTSEKGDEVPDDDGGSGGGGGDKYPLYVAGTPYKSGEVVSNIGSLYQCISVVVESWCSSDAAWAYEPGVGSDWAAAWSVYIEDDSVADDNDKNSSGTNEEMMIDCGGNKNDTSTADTSSATMLSPFGNISRTVMKLWKLSPWGADGR